MPLDGIDLDPGRIGANIANARKRAEPPLNQKELADRVGVSRATLVSIESGQRPPSSTVLAAIADALKVRVRDIVALPVQDEAATIRFRNPLRGDESAEAAVNALIDFARRYAILEEQIGRRRVRTIPPLALNDGDDVEHVAEDLATAERSRFNLGDGPLLDLRSVLENDVGMLIFGLPELGKTKIAGLFTFAQDLPMVGFNVRQADPRRRRWTLAHEYAHYLTNRFDAEVTYEAGERRSRDPYEQLAERFAAHYLMPASGVTRRFAELIGGAKSATVAHVVMLANQFRVSFQAMCERLERLDRIPRNTYDYVMAQGFRPIEAELSLGIERKDEKLSSYPARYIYLLSVLHRRGAVSEGDAAAYLQTDRLSAREALSTIEADPFFPMDMSLEDLS
ncbi:MAG TPA: XRE family transcriptional regulator [Candidatus Sulfotelmatobacter sp.]|nr:XRE family transcriptional regulator [Candidatus Sulfotelmatobacter sp.]